MYIACGPSDEATKKNGVVSVLVEQVLHHGAYNPEGPNRRITPLEGVVVTVNSSKGETIASPTTDTQGKVRLELPEGSYVLIVPERNDEFASAYSPAPERITLVEADSMHIDFRYAIFAP